MKSRFEMYSILMILLFLSYSPGLFSQKAPISFGNPEESELNMTIYPQDSSANAIVLCDYGNSYFEYNISFYRWQIFFERTMRIKVLGKTGVAAGNFSFKLFKIGNLSESIMNLEGITYNQENGKVIRTKLEKSAIMQEEFDKNHILVKFAMPNVKAGSVIDVKYKINSDFLFNLQPWYFQQLFPVKWSEYTVQIPEYLVYNHTLIGYNPLVVNETSTSSKVLTMSRLHYSNTDLRMAMEYVPKFTEEAYLSSANNYMSILSFELASAKSPDGVYEDITTTWEKIDELLLGSDDFGSASKHARFLDAVIDSIRHAVPVDSVRMYAVFDFIRHKIRWNGYKTIFANDTRRAWKEGSGNSADINLLLNAALRRADFEATPVVMSSRSNGLLNPTHPSIAGLDYVISCVKIGDKQFLLDATEKYSPAGLLPERCLNDKGRTVTSTGGDWVELTARQGDILTAQYILKLDAEGNVEGKSTHMLDAYGALDYRNLVKKSASTDEYYKDKEKKIPGFSILHYSIPTLDSVNLPLRENLEFRLTDAAEVRANLILINPFLFETIKNNPFRLNERLYPVEFPYPINETLIFNWQLPDGLVVDQLPKPAMVSLPGNAGKFTYNISQIGNSITVLSKIQINKTLYHKDEYELIKEFYNQIVSKQAEQIVLKRTL